MILTDISDFYNSDDVILNTSPYKPTPADDFPVASYMYYKYKRPPKYSHTTNKFSMKIDEFKEMLINRGYTLLFQKSVTEFNMIMGSFIYEKGDTLVRFGYDARANSMDDLLYDDEYPPPYIRDDVDEDSISYINLVSNDESEYNDIKSIADSNIKKVIHQNKVSLVVQDHSSYRTERFELPKYELDLKTNYPPEFEPIHHKILSTLSTNSSKGLVLLHGTPGTGKTHYLKYIASLIEGKEILFIPPFLTDFLTSPQMIPFLISKKNSILFIEDAERVITDRNDVSSTGVSNILNLTDGILSDILNIQIVATFNMDKQKIDPALLRKGRLIAEYEFKELSVDMSNTLLKKLGSDVKTDKPMTLTEIYNIAEPEFKEEVQSKPKIGF
jgi:hypothetical protein